MLLTATIGLAASTYVSAANASGLYVGVGVPIAVTTPPVVAEIAVTPPLVAPIAVEYDPTVVVGQDYYFCGPGWRGYG